MRFGIAEPTRRELLQRFNITISASLLPIWAGRCAAQQSGKAAGKKDAEKLAPLNRFPRDVHEYFVSLVRQVEQSANDKRSRLKTMADAVAYVQDVRRKICDCFGPFPQRTTLHSRITGIVERDAYRIEKVIFESRPQFLVTANLYVPKGRKLPAPGVVGSCGHSANGKAADAYQSFAQGLARMGYVVLLFDPIGQGERLQYLGKDRRSSVGVGTSEHLKCGNQQFLVGEFFGAWRAWDGIRALDYLLSRPEVDPKHVGITGNSGGGTMTTWLCGLEPRFTMAAPGCFVTTLRRNLENELPADTEQCPPKALALGLDHSDFLAAMAPKPIIILAKERDYFDVRGTLEAYARLRGLYHLLGAEHNIALHIGPTEHGYTQENREAMYRWFNRVTGVSDAKTEPKLTLEKDETLWCSPKGQVGDLESRPVYSFTKSSSEQLARQRKPLDGEPLNETVAKLLRIPERKGAPQFRILRALSSRRHPLANFTSYAVETDPGLHAIVYRLAREPVYSRPPQTGRRAILYVSHHSADAELRGEPLVRELIAAEPNVVCFACDVRGIGESRPKTCGDDTFSGAYGSDFFYAIHSLMLDRPYLGQKTHDLLCVFDWLAAAGHTDIHLAALGWGALPATFAAMLSNNVKQVTLKKTLSSYSAVAESINYNWPLSSFISNVLAHLDLPDCYRALAAKQLRLVEPRAAIF